MILIFANQVSVNPPNPFNPRSTENYDSNAFVDSAATTLYCN
jgi:hypothetical protein